MAKLLKLRRGNTSQHGSFTGAEGEVTVDTDKDTLVVHDGSQAGGRPLLREDMSNLPAGTIDNADINASAAIAGTKVSPDFGSQNIATTGNASIGGTNLNMSSAYIDFSGSLGSAPTTAAAIYRPADNSLAISTGNTQRLLVNNSGAAVTGNLDVSSGIDVTSGNITLADAGEIRLGASGDLQIYHDGNQSYINDTGAGSLRLQTDSLQVRNTGNTANKFTVDTSTGQVNIVNNLDVGAGIDVTGDSEFTGDVKFKTASTGRDILFDRSADALKFEDNALCRFGDSNDLTIYHDGTDTYIDNNEGNLNILCDSSQAINLKHGTDNMLRAITDGAVELYHDGTKRFETDTSGSVITGRLAFNNTGSSIQLADDQKAAFGAGQDLQIYHDGTTNRIDAVSGNLHIKGTNLSLKSYAGETYIDATADGAVEIYHGMGGNAAQKKFETTSTGVSVTGALVATDDITAFSDQTLKKDVTTINDALGLCGKLRGVSYKRIKDDKPSIGVIAQEIEQHIPEIVTTTQLDGKDVKSVDYGKIVGVLINAVNELKAELDEYKATYEEIKIEDLAKKDGDVIQQTYLVIKK